ncbi:MAG: hypothetical protein UY21_C0002G0018 [Microgenomates group bacterium GW2011_GWA1_48_10]|uniref:Uncharacterized protein n=1 Tax=Candidatus Gottesmanbacteria bacterium RIFCSPHIGHO2_01_FULL_47_48 TaxID=1798381 RepID=A0A1F5ZZC7_9BACT|nr:MAG: hypothetical protein UY21_C0002G0018 [Microgenomates group bacterium GW2011_GWA1_48_10]OGG17811.1 MAG: hypothetical protein A2721_02200 [Candidatus Gottesmanbacteria bacterium RIFCSPHIGHO2_01_FULL_47_48]
MKFKDKAWLIISLLTLATAVVWLGVTLATTLRRSTVPQNVNQLTTPLNPDLDLLFLQSLKQRSR